MARYSIKACFNEKVFPKRSRRALANRIVDSVVLIHGNVYKANNKRKRKIKKHKGLLDKGMMTEEQIEQSFEGWKAHAKKGNNFKAVQRMTVFYRRTMMG